MRLGPRDLRAVALGASVIVLALALSRGLPAWWDIVDRARFASFDAARARADAIALTSAAPTMRDSLVARQRRLARLRDGMIRSVTAAEAASALTATISDAARAAGLALGALTPRADTAAGERFTRPSVRGEARGDVSGLSQFLLLVEADPRLLDVRDLTVIQAEPHSRGRPEELQIAFTIAALALLEPRKAEAEGGRP